MSRVDLAAEREKVYAAESAVAVIRVGVILLNSAYYAFFLDQAGTIPWLAYTVIASANLYGIGVYALQPYRRYPVMLSSYFTTCLDAAFITVWLFATGGFESPFYMLWLLSITAVAFRYDLRATLFAAGVYAASYVALLAAMGELLPSLPEVGLRLGYLFLVAALGGYLSREVFVQTRAKVELQEATAALRESEERFRRLSDASYEGIVMHEGGRILEVNAAIVRMFGYTAEEMRDLSPAQLVDPVSLPEIARRLASKDDSPFNAIARRKDGTTFEIEATARDLPWEGRSVRVVAVHDVSERRRAERAISENERLREIDTIKTKFINSAAHELGTPLTPIKLQAHLLRLGGLGELNDKQRRALDVLSRNVDHLGLMVKDLLDASRVQTHELRLSVAPVKLDHLLSEAVEAFASRDVEVVYDGERDLTIEGDAPRLLQVAFNLIGNALKFTPKGGRIVVRAARAGGEVHVEVADDGAGIEPADLAKLFRPFSQVHDTTTTSRAGAGLGLFISKGIVESHGGRIWATSEGRGRGTTMHFTLPMARSAARLGVPR